MKKGQKCTAEQRERMRLAHIGQPSKRKGTKCRPESIELMRAARSRQVHPDLAHRGITKEQYDEAIANGLKWCCGEHKCFVPAGTFPKPNAPRCSECIAKRSAAYRERCSPERLQELAANTKDWRGRNPAYEKRYRLLAKYGVTPEWYDQTLEAQSGHCALCLAKTGTSSGRILFVDHDHASGKARGLLCARCNIFIGVLEAARDWPERARAYLEFHG